MLEQHSWPDLTFFKCKRKQKNSSLIAPMGKANHNGIFMEARAHLDLHAAPGGQGTGDFTWAVGVSMGHGSSLPSGTAQHGMPQSL